MEVLVVVDMQNDFIDGSLGTKEAVSIVPKVADKIKNFKGLVLATRDTHEENYLSTQEMCIRDSFYIVKKRYTNNGVKHSQIDRIMCRIRLFKEWKKL